jgi:hypothetical protein
MKREIILRRHDLILMPLKLFILEIWKENFEKGKSKSMDNYTI